MNPVRAPGKILTPRMPVTSSEPRSPTPYPLPIASFSKLFWKTGNNIKMELFRLSPGVFPDIICLVAVDLDSGEEMSRLFFDQMLLELLLRPQLDVAAEGLDPNKSAEIPTPELLKRSVRCLDNQSAALQKFFEKKAHIVDGGIKIRGLAAVELPQLDKETMANVLPKKRTKAVSFNSFETMHKTMEANMDIVRRKTSSATDSLKAAAKAMETVSMFNNLMARTKQKKVVEKAWSPAKRRWKKCIAKVLMNAAIDRTRARLLMLGIE